VLPENAHELAVAYTLGELQSPKRDTFLLICFEFLYLKNCTVQPQKNLTQDVPLHRLSKTIFKIIGCDIRLGAVGGAKILLIFQITFFFFYFFSIIFYRFIEAYGVRRSCENRLEMFINGRGIVDFLKMSAILFWSRDVKPRQLEV